MPPVVVPRRAPVLSDSGISRTRQWMDTAVRVVADMDLPIPASVALGLTYTESRGDPYAIGDGGNSIGLMQINTAEHPEYTKEQLRDPETNIRAGMTLLAQLYNEHGGDLEAAISSYNGGHGNRQAQGTPFCLEWKSGTPSSGRTIENNCARVYITGAGEFGNQPYVDEVLAAASSFGYGGGLDGSPSGSGPVTADAGGGGSTAFAVVAVLIGAALSLLNGRRR